MRIPRPGLRGKLALSIGVIILAALGAGYLAVYRGTGAELESRTERDLELESEGLAARMAGPGADRPDELSRRARILVGTDTFGPNARIVVIDVHDGATATNQPELLKRHSSDDGHSGSDGSDDHHGDSGEGSDRHHEADRILDAPPGYTTVSLDDVGSVRLLSREVDLPGDNRATITVGQSLAPVDAALEGLRKTFLLVGLITLLVAAAAAWLLASRVTRPMRRMAAVAEGVDGGDLSARMPTARDEVGQLAESFNRMLERLEQAFDRQKAFVADASHDLRTPLTVVRGQIEVLARNPVPTAADVGVVADTVSQAVARMERMTDDLLLLARAEIDDPARRETVQLAPLLTAEVESTSLVADRRIELGQITDQAVAIDREQISRAVANLLSNSVRHTAPGGRIAVSATSDGREVMILVDDDGPGVPVADRARIFDRFSRLDRSRTSDSGGSGLGLAIVKAVAEAHGGSARCVESPLGGARFLIAIPAALPGLRNAGSG